MKRLIAILIGCALCLTAVPAFAAEAVTDVHVTFFDARGNPPADLAIDHSLWAGLVDRLQAAREQQEPAGKFAPSTGTGLMAGLSVTSDGITQKVFPQNFSRTPEWTELEYQIEELPGVMRAIDDYHRVLERERCLAGSQAELSTVDKLLGTTYRPVSEKNPPALAVKPGQIDTVQIYDESGLCARVTDDAQRARLLNLVNFVDVSAPLGRAPQTDRTAYPFRLELRGKDGAKLEYQLDETGANLLVNGVKYGDAAIVRLFGPVLADIFYQNETNAAWLCYMNPKRIVDMRALAATGAPVTPQAMLDVAQELRGLRVAHPVEYVRGETPGRIRGRDEGKYWTLTFDSGVVYDVRQYDGCLTVESSDMKNAWMYVLVR